MFKLFDSYSWFIVTSFICGFFFLVNIIGGIDWWSICSFNGFGEYFFFDMISCYLVFLSVLLYLSLFCLFSDLGFRSKSMLFLSIISSLFCYCCCNVFLFWVFYEVSILSLLYLLVSDSPYSERYSASWYLLGYVVLTSLPMLLCIFYFSVEFGTLNMLGWLYGTDICFDLISFYFLLGVLFITKVPLPPFHVWLPIVHAEASSSVSMCLSGYIMKLGLLGVCRLCYFILPDYLFSYVFVCIFFCMSVMFFMSACRELDGKRWLALLSLSHITIAGVSLFACSFSNVGLSYLYSLGHGLAAGLVFLFLWWLYELSGSRNWYIVKFVFGGSLLFRVLLVVCMFTAGSLPPTVQFFSEVGVLLSVSCVSSFVLFIFCFYLFFSSLVPFFLLGGLLTRHFNVEFNSYSCFYSYITSIFFLLLWCFLLFVVL